MKQMRVVGLPDRVVRRGVQDYYRAYAQRSKWAREKLLLDTELSKYDKSLEDRWGKKARRRAHRWVNSYRDGEQNIGL